MNPQELALILSKTGKPEEIAGTLTQKIERIQELLRWFSRLASDNANPKWLKEHAFELVYYIATTDQLHLIDLAAIRHKSFLEGCNITSQEREALQRVGCLPS